MPNTLAIIGAGRVGRALGRRLREVGWKIGAVVTRGEPSAGRAVRFIGAGNACAGLTRQVLSSQVILITTPDDEIASAARELARIGEEELRGRIVLHTSGAMDSSALQAVQERGATDRAGARRNARARRGKQETFVSRGGGDGRRSCPRGRGSSHAVARVAWDEAERSRACVVALDAPGSG